MQIANPMFRKLFPVPITRAGTILNIGTALNVATAIGTIIGFVEGSAVTSGTVRTSERRIDLGLKSMFASNDKRMTGQLYDRDLSAVLIGILVGSASVSVKVIFWRRFPGPLDYTGDRVREGRSWQRARTSEGDRLRGLRSPKWASLCSIGAIPVGGFSVDVGKSPHCL